jgi:hypothetical protein
MIFFLEAMISVIRDGDPGIYAEAEEVSYDRHQDFIR